MCFPVCVNPQHTWFKCTFTTQHHAWLLGNSCDSSFSVHLAFLFTPVLFHAFPCLITTIITFHFSFICIFLWCRDGVLGCPLEHRRVDLTALLTAVASELRRRFGIPSSPGPSTAPAAAPSPSTHLRAPPTCEFHCEFCDQPCGRGHKANHGHHRCAAHRHL